MKLVRATLSLFVLCVLVSGQAKPDPREDAYRANNLGVALLEQFKNADAVAAFQRALKTDPKLNLARINLAIALYNVPDLAASEREARAATAADPASPQPHYILGLILRQQNKPDEAIAEFRKVLAVDASDVGSNVNIGQIYSQRRQHTEAIPPLRAAVAAEPYNVTAVYNLATAIQRSGSATEEAAELFKRFQALRTSGAGTSIGPSYLEQGRYAEAIASTGAEPGLADAPVEVKFVDATSTAIPKLELPPPAAGAFGAMALFDADADGDLDLFVASGASQRFLANDKGVFRDATEASGIPASAAGSGGAVVAGDYDNDTKPDLLVAGRGYLALYHNEGGGKFTDQTKKAGLPALGALALSAAFVDVDHDGDLDIFLGGSGAATPPDAAWETSAGAKNVLLRNNGDGTFVDGSAAAKIDGAPGHATAIVPSDYDNRRDVDLVVAGNDEPVRLLRNLRDGTFSDVAKDVGLAVRERVTSAAAGDVNKDGYTDFLFASASGAHTLAVTDGKGRFAVTPGPTGFPADAAQFLDYDDDGVLDFVAFGPGGLRVWRQDGKAWSDATAKVAAGVATDSFGGAGALARRALASADVDGDGDTDLVVLDGAGKLAVLKNEGGNANKSIAIQLAGRVSNRSGVGAKVEMRAGSLRARVETYSASPAPAPADVLFGLGKRTAPDAVRILWPTGIIQAETEFPDGGTNATATRAPLSVTELDRKPSSCPFLYTWNGERFEFVTDFMGGGEMGYNEGPGLYNHPDPDEYVRIRGDQLKERDGRYELRVTNELEEVLFVDRLRLLSVAHPADVEVFPYEGLLTTPPPFKLFTTRGAIPPVAATDDEGRDVLASASRLDRDFVKGFETLALRGYAKTHGLTLDLGPDVGGRTLLLLTGWTDYAFSSDNVAAHQRGLQLAFPSLQVRDETGAWTTVVDNIGIPIGRPQTLVVDLTGKFLSASREVRIVTNMRVYWDQILVDTSAKNAPMRVERLDPAGADLRWRGYSRQTSPDGVEPYGYDYDDVSPLSPWKVFAGRYTREGDVRELLAKTDDVFVVSRTGDEIALSFDATRLAPLPDGWTRTFLLYADGYSKEMDVNSASPYQIEPYPFHGMSGYPYTATERYPLTKKRKAYIETYNTRVVVGEVPSIETTLP